MGCRALVGGILVARGERDPVQALQAVWWSTYADCVSFTNQRHSFSAFSDGTFVVNRFGSIRVRQALKLQGCALRMRRSRRRWGAAVGAFAGVYLLGGIPDPAWATIGFRVPINVPV